jgi:creatinine amidohydrolase
VPFGLTNYADSFPGWISLKPATLWALLEDLVASLEQNGVLRVAFCNAHLEPAHVRVLRGVAGDHAAPPAKCRAQVVFPDHTRRRWAATLGEEFAGGDCHAGRYETSIVMAEDPAGVREARRKALPPVSIGLIAAMQRGVRGFAAAGAREAYCGDPASASAGEGEELVDRLATMVETTCRETWPEAFGAEPGAS